MKLTEEMIEVMDLIEESCDANTLKFLSEELSILADKKHESEKLEVKS